MVAMDLLNERSLPVLQALQFRDQLGRGELWLPQDVSGDRAELLAWMVRDLPELTLTVHVDTDNGTASVWQLATALSARGEPTEAFIGKRAKSAGLIIAVACRYRICQQGTVFLYHGSPYKAGVDDDRRKAEWFAKRTTRPFDFWLEMAAGGEGHEFDCYKAREWGVVHEIEGVPLGG